MAKRSDKGLTYQVGKRIRAARIATGLTQQQLADSLHLSLRYISNIESGNTGITLTTLREVCKVLSVSSDRLLFGEDFKENDSSIFLEQIKMVAPDDLPYLQSAMEAYIRFLGNHGRTFQEKKS